LQNIPKTLKANRKDETILQGNLSDENFDNGKHYGPTKIKVLHKWENKDLL
jgi:hypothetical protein